MITQDFIVTLLVEITKMTTISPKAGIGLWREHAWTPIVFLPVVTIATHTMSDIWAKAIRLLKRGLFLGKCVSVILVAVVIIIPT